MAPVVDPIESRIQQHLAAVLESAGVSPAFVVKAVQRIDAALDATRTQRVHVGEEIKEFHDVDHNTRLSASDRALELAARAGLIPAQSDGRRGGPSGPAISVNIVILGPNGEKSLVSIKPELAG